MSTSLRCGLVLFGLLSAGDIADLAITDGTHPPYSVAVLGAVLGIASLYLVVSVWRGNRRMLLPLVALRILSALTAVPAFFVSGVPAAALGSAVAIVALTGLGVLFVAPTRSRAAATR